jgi:hypothetical protein
MIGPPPKSQASRQRYRAGSRRGSASGFADAVDSICFAFPRALGGNRFMGP